MKTNPFTERIYHYMRELGFSLFPINSKKIPQIPNWNTIRYDAPYSPELLYGAMPPPNILIADIDVKNHKTGIESWTSFLNDNPSLQRELHRLPTFANVKTGSGGYHVYLNVSDIDYTRIPKTCHKYPGIDFLIHGKSFAVCGGQQLDNGWYTLDNLIIFDKLTALDCFTDTNPYPTPIQSSQPPKKIKYEASHDLSLSQIQTLLDYISSDDYDIWYKMAWILKSTSLPEHIQKDLWIEWSRKSSKYKEGSCESKWDSLDKDYNQNLSEPLTPATLVWLARSQNSHNQQALLEINNLLNNTDIESLRGRICRVQSVTSSVHYYDLQIHAWLNEAGAVKTLQPLIDSLSTPDKPKDDKSKQPPKPKKITMQNLINKGLIPIPIDTSYSPDRPAPLFTDEHGRLYLNEYTTYSLPPSLPYEQSDQVEFYTQHVYQIFGEKYATDYLSYMAYLAQNPGKKIRYMLVLEGGKGTGKGLLLQGIKNHVLGTENCRSINTNEILSDYNGWAFKSQLIHIDELLIRGKGADRHINTLKTLITDDKATRREKYLTTAEIPCCASFVALTNFKSSLKYTNDNRRYHAIVSPIRTPEDLDLRGFASPAEYYNYLAYIVSPENPRGGELRHFFLNYSILASFNPNSRPPISDYDKFKDESNKTDEYEDYYDLVYHLARQDTLPPYINIHEMCSASTQRNPNTEAPFFEEAITPKQVKKFGKHANYSPHAGWLYSNDLNSTLAKETCLEFSNAQKRRSYLFTTKEALDIYNELRTSK